MNRSFVISSTLALAFAFALVACGPSNRDPGNNPGTDGTGPACSEGQRRCNSSTYEVCSSGNWVIQEDCMVTCNETLGCVNCQPGEAVCKDGNVHTCDAGGEVGGQSEACTGSTICAGGTCVDACADAADKKSYIGCEYWAVDLDNAVEVRRLPTGAGTCPSGEKNITAPICVNGTQLSGLCDPPAGTCPANFTCETRGVCVLDAQGSPFAIVVSNPQSRDVAVTVSTGAGASFTQTVAAGAVTPILPQATPMPGLPDQSIDGTGIEPKAYKVVSDLPIVAYQFNPLDNVNVFSNDASLLIPRTAWDIEYYVMTMATLDRRPQNHAYHGYLSVVSYADGTVVEVTPSATVRASATQASIAAGTPTMFTLGAFDVLTLQATAGGDLTGSRVRSVDGTTPIGVFGGHEANVFGETTPPNGTQVAGPCCADHLEEMLFPTSTWGKEFAIARSRDRGTNEPDMLRVIAQKPNTIITFNPAPASGTCGTLMPGQHCEVKIRVDTAITATEPVMIGHFLQSAIWQDPIFGSSVGEGDPSFALAVPVEQYRTEYTVLVPQAYGKNFMSISAPANGAIIVDGVGIVMTPFANGLYRGARHQVNPGQHKVSCPNGCGITMYGYSSAVSYMFAGGLDLKQIVIQ